MTVPRLLPREAILLKLLGYATLGSGNSFRQSLYSTVACLLDVCEKKRASSRDTNRAKAVIPLDAQSAGEYQVMF